MEADDKITDGLSQLRGTTTISSDDTMALIEKAVSQLYLPKSEMSFVSKVRWWLFRKIKAPLNPALRQAILRAHHQALVWNNNVAANRILPSPESYGWKLHGDNLGSCHNNTPSSTTSHHTSSQVQVRQRAVFHKSLPV